MAGQYPLSVYIAIFLIAFNSGAVLLDTTGAADYLGINPDTGDTDELDEAEEAAGEFETGTGQGQTLLGTYNRLAGVMNSIVNGVQPGKEMLEASGVPASLTGFLWSVMGIILGWDVAQFIRSG